MRRPAARVERWALVLPACVRPRTESHTHSQHITSLLMKAGKQESIRNSVSVRTLGLILGVYAHCGSLCGSLRGPISSIRQRGMCVCLRGRVSVLAEACVRVALHLEVLAKRCT